MEQLSGVDRTPPGYALAVKVFLRITGGEPHAKGILDGLAGAGADGSCASSAGNAPEAVFGSGRRP